MSVRIIHIIWNIHIELQRNLSYKVAGKLLFYRRVLITVRPFLKPNKRMMWGEGRRGWSAKSYAKIPSVLPKTAQLFMELKKTKTINLATVITNMHCNVDITTWLLNKSQGISYLEARPEINLAHALIIHCDAKNNLKSRYLQSCENFHAQIIISHDSLTRN